MILIQMLLLTSGNRRRIVAILRGNKYYNSQSWPEEMKLE